MFNYKYQTRKSITPQISNTVREFHHTSVAPSVHRNYPGLCISVHSFHKTSKSGTLLLHSPDFEGFITVGRLALRLHQHGPHMGDTRRLRVIIRNHVVHLALRQQRRFPVVGRYLVFCQVLVLGLGAVLPGDKHVLCFRMHTNFAAKDVAFAIVNNFNKPRKTYEPVRLDQRWLCHFLSFLSAIIACLCTFTNHFNR